MFIDEKGKLFGKLSVIDLAIVLIAIFAIAILILSIQFNVLKKNTMQVECTYTVLIKNIKQISYEPMSVGKTVSDFSKVNMGTVIERKVANAQNIIKKDNGESVLAENPNRYDVYLTIKAKGIKKASNMMIDGKKIGTSTFLIDGKKSIYIGTTTSLRLVDVDFECTITDFKLT